MGGRAGGVSLAGRGPDVPGGVAPSPPSPPARLPAAVTLSHTVPSVEAIELK